MHDRESGDRQVLVHPLTNEGYFYYLLDHAEAVNKLCRKYAKYYRTLGGRTSHFEEELYDFIVLEGSRRDYIAYDVEIGTLEPYLFYRMKLRMHRYAQQAIRREMIESISQHGQEKKNRCYEMEMIEIQEYFDYLDEREKLIVYAKVIREWSYDRIGEVIGVSGVQARKYYLAAIETLQTRFGKAFRS